MFKLLEIYHEILTLINIIEQIWKEETRISIIQKIREKTIKRKQFS